jgi:dihydroorotate dehydrogenase
VYRLLFHLVLRRLDPEASHELATRLLRAVRATKPGRALIARFAGAPDPSLRVQALGLRFPSPLGVAAGLDKDARWHEDLGALGFGFVEVGTVTAQAQSGNPRPRIERVIGQRGLINRMGFPNPGARVVASRLASRSPQNAVIGANVGKSRAVDLDDAIGDYRESVRLLAPVSDYIAINVSSPNTPGLRELQSPERLKELIIEVRAELETVGHPRPLLVKLAPDLSDEQLDAVAGLAVELELDGIIAVNTTAVEGGGLSGAPLAARAEQVLRRLRALTRGRLVLISVGGVQSAQDVWDRLQAGATLVQAYTGFVYGGPSWPARVNRDLARLLKRAGYATLEDALDRDIPSSALVP